MVAFKRSSQFCGSGYDLQDCMYTSASEFIDLTSQYNLESIIGLSYYGFWIWIVTGTTDNGGQYSLSRNHDDSTMSIDISHQNDVLCLNGRSAEFPSGACGLSNCY